MRNTEKIQKIYEAFGEGNIPAILKYLTDSVEWEYGAGDIPVPWLQRRHGIEEVPKFFETLGQLQIHQFKPKAFLENGNLVVVLIDLEATVKATGKKIVEEDEVHLWHFAPDGKVSRFRHRTDTYQHAGALGVI